MTRPTPFPLRLDSSVRKRLEELAAAEGRTLSNYLANLIQKAIYAGPEAGERYSYTRQKFWQAIDCLVGTRDIGDRLAGAHNHLLVLKSGNPDLPDSMRSQFESLMDSLSRHAKYFDNAPPRIEMSEPEANRTAEMILSLYVELKGGI